MSKTYEQMRIEMEQQYNQVKNSEHWRAVVTDIIESKAGNIYKDTASDPEQPVIVVYYRVADGEVKNEVFSLPKSASSWKRDNFKLGQFVKKYGSMPFIGQEIQAVVADDSYFRIVL